jgi:hemoglobin
MTQAEAAPTAAQTLYERLGAETGLRAIVSDIVEAHLANPTIGARFKKSDLALAKAHAFEFFSMGSGGPHAYTGKPLPEAHAAMNINETEFVAACDDVLAVLRKHGISEREQAEVLAIFFALKGEVLHL